MNCFPCFSPRRRGIDGRIEDTPRSDSTSSVAVDASSGKEKNASYQESWRSESAKKFAFKDLATACRNFQKANVIGEGGFGRVYKGRLDTGQMVAIKQLNHDGAQGSKEFLVEVLMLVVLQHPNLVSLVGYCAEGGERLLVYEYMPKGSLEDHLFNISPKRPPLDWNARIKIALGVAKGLTYLHNVANPPVIYRDMKAANILLDNDFNPKLSDFGLAKLGPVGDKTHVSTRVMGTYGYCAPDYAMSGKLTLKSDVYSFGVLLLELITGRRAFDPLRAHAQRNLTLWVRPFLNDRRKSLRLADPYLQRCFPPQAFQQLVAISSMCLKDQAHVRPTMTDVVATLEVVASQPYAPEAADFMSTGRAPSLNLRQRANKDQSQGKKG